MEIVSENYPPFLCSFFNQLWIKTLQQTLTGARQLSKTTSNTSNSHQHLVSCKLCSLIGFHSSHFIQVKFLYERNTIFLSYLFFSAKKDCDKVWSITVDVYTMNFYFFIPQLITSTLIPALLDDFQRVETLSLSYSRKYFCFFIVMALDWKNSSNQTKKVKQFLNNFEPSDELDRLW